MNLIIIKFTVIYVFFKWDFQHVKIFIIINSTYLLYNSIQYGRIQITQKILIHYFILYKY